LYQLIDGLLHWSTCYSTETIEPIQSSYLSAQRLSIEILTKLSVYDMNMDFLLATPSFYRIISLFHILIDWLMVDELNGNISSNINRSQPYIQREFAIVLLNALIRCDSIASIIIANIPYAISSLINFLEDYEIKTNELMTRYGSDLTQQNEEMFVTTNDMLKRAATCLLSIVSCTDNIKIMKKYEDRILNLSISHIIDLNTGRILTDILHHCSLYNS
jgi:AT-rich interactive domain-containing protein 1